MPNDLYLIAHKVRGEPAFDVASKIECSECAGIGEIGGHPDKPMFGCNECDSTGFWWIIPTSGHRAYPYWNTELADLREDQSWPGEPSFPKVLADVPPMPPSLPDHYPSRAAPTISLAEALGLHRPRQPAKPFPRRL